MLLKSYIYFKNIINYHKKLINLCYNFILGAGKKEAGENPARVRRRKPRFFSQQDISAKYPESHWRFYAEKTGDYKSVKPEDFARRQPTAA